jgi:uncharacterized protein
MYNINNSLVNNIKEIDIQEDRAINPSDEVNQRMQRAMEEGDRETIAHLLRSNWIDAVSPADLQHGFRGPNGETLLHIAVELQDVKAVEQLIKQGLAVDVRDGADHTPLAAALRGNDVALVEKLLELGADPFAKLPDSTTPLEEAERLEVHAATDKMLDRIGKQFSPQELRQKGVAEIVAQMAIARNREDLLGALLAAGVDVNARPSGATLLHWATFAANLPLVNLLLDKGADTNLLSEQKTSALYAAVLRGDEPLVRRLRKAGARMDIGTGELPLLHSAFASERPGPIAHILVEEGALDHLPNINACDRQRNTLLHLASQAGMEELVSQLIARKADPNATNLELDTPLHLAARVGHAAVVQRLLHAPAIETDVYNLKNETPLLAAAAAAERSILVADPAWSTLFEKTVTRQIKRLQKRMLGKPVYALTRGRNLERTLQVSQSLSLGDKAKALESEAKTVYRLYETNLADNIARAGFDPNVESLKALVSPARWDETIGRALIDPRMQRFAVSAGRDNPITRCVSTAGVIAWYLVTHQEAEAPSEPTGVYLPPTQRGVCSLRSFLAADNARFYHCYTFVRNERMASAAGDHVFIIERVSKGRYRIHQSYVDAIALHEVLGHAAYGSLSGGDLSPEDLDKFLKKIERLEGGDWSAKEQRTYRDLFYSSSSAAADTMSFFFYASHGRNLLMEAVASGNSAGAMALLRSPHSPNVIEADAGGNTALHLVKGDPELVSALLTAPGGFMTLWTQNQAGETPLTAAVSRGAVAVARALIRYGAHPAIPDGSRRSALQIATERGDEEMLKMLRENEAPIIRF